MLREPYIDVLQASRWLKRYDYIRGSVIPGRSSDRWRWTIKPKGKLELQLRASLQEAE
jgi:hypothetical protein